MFFLTVQDINFPVKRLKLFRYVGGTYTCGHAQRSTFSAGIEAPVQYGPSVSAFAVYMTQYQLVALPAHRRGAQ